MIDAWYGTERSYRETEKMLSADLTQLRSGGDDDEPNPVKTEIVQGLGIMHIRGPMISSGNWMTRWFGIVSYDDIKEAAAKLAGNHDVKAILAVYDSPGGAAKGCKACADYLRDINDNDKPVVSFTDDAACSAAYWLYCAGQTRIAGENAQLGSVGAIIVHTEYSEMDKQMGIGRTVLRSAPYKALVTPFEKLTEESEKELTDELAYLHDSFVSGISHLTGISAKKVADTIANGKVYRTPEALNLKLADARLSFGEVVSKLAKRFNRKPAASK